MPPAVTHPAPLLTLSQARIVVGTLSSNWCRLVWELHDTSAQTLPRFVPLGIFHRWRLRNRDYAEGVRRAEIKFNTSGESRACLDE